MNNDDPMVLTMLCAAHTVIGDLDIASALIDKALALDPNSAMAWGRSGWVNYFLMRPEVGIEHFQRAIRLSPFDPMNFHCLFGIGCAHYMAGRCEEALFWIRRGILEHRPMAPIARVMAICLVRLGRISEAREVVRDLREEFPDLTVAKVKAIVPFRDADFVRRSAEDLRLAGLPE
jgi:adenylate cyclase